MRKGIDGEIFEKKPERLILDLSAVDFMDSSGLGLVLGRYASVQKIGGELVVLNPSERVMKILLLAGAERIIKIEKVDEETAKRLTAEALEKERAYYENEEPIQIRFKEQAAEELL